MMPPGIKKMLTKIEGNFDYHDKAFKNSCQEVYIASESGIQSGLLA